MNVLLLLLLLLIVAFCSWMGGFWGGLLAGFCLCLAFFAAIGLHVNNKARSKMAIINKLKNALNERA